MPRHGQPIVCQNHFEPGDKFMKPGHQDRHDPMAAYTFDGWADVPASNTGGRVANATWDFNGTAASAWEADMRPLDPVARDRAESDPCQRGTDGCCIDHRHDTECDTW